MAIRNDVQITCKILGNYHVQHAVHHVVLRDSSAVKFDRNEVGCDLAFFYVIKSVINPVAIIAIITFNFSIILV